MNTTLGFFRYGILSCVVMILFAACQHSANAKSSSDPCSVLAQALQETYINTTREGQLIFSGGLEGTMDASGVDYNAMTCTYKVVDCLNGKLNMRCDGSQFSVDFIMYSRDSIFFADATYLRKK